MLSQHFMNSRDPAYSPRPPSPEIRNRLTLGSSGLQRPFTNHSIGYYTTSTWKEDTLHRTCCSEVQYNNHITIIYTWNIQMEYSSRLLIGIQNHSLALQQVLCRTATRPFLPRAGGEIHSVLQLVKGRAQERLSYVPIHFIFIFQGRNWF